MAMIFPVVVGFEVDTHGQAYADFRESGDVLDGFDARDEVDQ